MIQKAALNACSWSSGSIYSIRRCMAAVVWLMPLLATPLLAGEPDHVISYDSSRSLQVYTDCDDNGLTARAWTTICGIACDEPDVTEDLDFQDWDDEVPIGTGGITFGNSVDLSVHAEDTCQQELGLRTAESTAGASVEYLIAADANMISFTASAEIGYGVDVFNPDCPRECNPTSGTAILGVRDFQLRLPIMIEQTGYLYTESSNISSEVEGFIAAGLDASIDLECCENGECKNGCRVPDFWGGFWSAGLSSSGVVDSGFRGAVIDPGEYVVVIRWSSHGSWGRSHDCFGGRTIGGSARHEINLNLGYTAIDCDNDTDNTNVVPDYGPDRDLIEELEETAGTLGRLVAVNNDDDDNDGVLDDLDGFNRDGIPDNADDENLAEDDFVRVVLEIPDFLGMDERRVSLTTTETTYYLRMWKKIGSDVREASDQIVPGVYTPAELGFTDTQRVIEIWVEGLRESEPGKVVELTLAASCPVPCLSPCSTGDETVPFHTRDLRIDLDVDSDNNSTASFCPPDLDAYEDSIEDDASLPGRFIQLTDVPEEPIITIAVLEVPASLDLDTAAIELDVPAGVTVNRRMSDGQLVEITSGWHSPADFGITAGDYVVDLILLGETPTVDSVRIRVGLDPDGAENGYRAMTEDAVRVLVYDASIEVVDPNPDLLIDSLDGVTIVSDPEQLAALSNPVNGLAADGVTRVVIRQQVPGPGHVVFVISDEFGSDGPENGLLGEINGSEHDTSIVVEAEQLNDGRWMAFCEMLAPLNYVRQSRFDLDSASSFRPIRIAAVTVSYSCSSTIAQFGLVRPPVVLLHGFLWTAGHFQWPLMSDSRFVTSAVDYANARNKRLIQNVHVARDGCKQVVQEMRNLDIAVSQCDVIGHGTGGLLLRMHAEDRYTFYDRVDNFRKGDFHKLITVNSPHCGTPLAEIVRDYANTPVNSEDPESLTLAQILQEDYDIDITIANSILEDLIPPESWGNRWSSINVPSHAIVGIGGKTFQDLVIVRGDQPFIYHAFIESMRLLFRLGHDYTREVFGGARHDVISSEASQIGGLPDRAVTRFDHIDRYRAGIHYLIGQAYTDVSDRLVELLNAPADTGINSLFAPGFRGNGCDTPDDSPPTGGSGGEGDSSGSGGGDTGSGP